MKGDCAIDGAAYEMTAWERNDQLTLSLAPARVGQTNTHPPEVFRGALDEAPKRASRGADAEGAEKPVWVGNVVGEEQSYAVRAFQKQGKSGPYLTLYFEGIETPPADS